MTVGLLEGLTSSIGDELTETGGFRSTRIAASVLAETRVQTGINNASSINGVTITFPPLTLLPAVAVGQRFRLLSGPNTNESDVILTKPDAQTLVLERGVPIGSPTLFSALSWEVIVDAAESILVETTLDWPTAGEVFIDGVRYCYASKTLTTLDGVRPERHLGRVGYITTIAGLLISDGETVTIDDGEGHIRTFEFDKNDIITYGNNRVAITNTSTANDVRDALIVAMNDIERLRVTASSGGAATVKLTHETSGGTGRIDVVDTVADTSFRTDGPRGVERDHTISAEVIDFTRNFSSIDIVRRSLLVDFAAGADLDVVGRNLGVLRPPPLSNDAVFREMIKALAYSPRGTVFALELILDALLGPGNYVIFEDLTLGSINHTCTVFVLRTNDNELDPEGKALLDGDEARPITDTTHVDVTSVPIRIEGVRFAPEPGLHGERLIDFGTNASTTNGQTVTTPAAGQFGTNIRRGDILEIMSGPLKGFRGVVFSRDSALQLTMTVGTINGATEGVPFIEEFVGLGSASFDWRITRPLSNFRYYLPTEETYIEYIGDAGTPIWTLTGNAGVLGSTATEGRFLTLTDAGAANTSQYRHRMRVHAESRAAFELLVSVPSAATVSAGAGDGLQFALRLRDGEREINLGTFDDGGTAVRYRPVDSTGTAIGSSFTSVPDGTYVTLKIVKNERNDVKFYRDDVLFATVAYALFPSLVTTTPNIEFGLFSATLTGMIAQIKVADWSVETFKDFWNVDRPNASLIGGGSRDIVDDAAGSFFLAGDVGKTVRIRDFSVLNTGGGNPRGEWQISMFVNANRVTLLGPTRRRGSTSGAFARRITVRQDPFAFTWPDHKGHSINIESGPNAGTYIIARLIDPITLADIDNQFPATSGDFEAATPELNTPGEIPIVAHTHIIETTVDLPDSSSDAEFDWHLVPNFATDANVAYELVNAGTLAGMTLTLRQALPISAPFIIDVGYSTVLSAQVLDESDDNIESPSGVFSFHPFYLFDNFGFIRDVLQLVTAAGVLVDVDSLFRDAAGFHILEE